MSRKSAAAALANPSGTLKGCLGKILTPAVFKRVHQAQRQAPARHPQRWDLYPLLMVLLLFAWANGDSQEERFEAARCAYVRLCPKRRRPGKTIQGFRSALARLPLSVLRAAAAAIRLHLLALFGAHWAVAGFAPLGVDGSRLQCPFSEELHNRTGQAAQEGHTCNIWVTALVHLPTGLLWSWWVGKADASERTHLERLLPTLPRQALVIADAGYQGFELATTLTQRGIDFLIRVSTQTTLHTLAATPADVWRDGLVVLWPGRWRAHAAPLRLRLLCVRSRDRKVDVWLLTNVLDETRLPLDTAALFYQMRWENELLFRTFKRTCKRVKLTSRTVRLLHREGFGALLATQVLLAQGAWGLLVLAKKPSALSSPRQLLRAIRREMAGQSSSRRGQQYSDRLQQAERERRRRTTKKEKRRFPQRRPHKPPSPPDVRRLQGNLKALISQYLSLE